MLIHAPVASWFDYCNMFYIEMTGNCSWSRMRQLEYCQVRWTMEAYVAHIETAVLAASLFLNSVQGAG